MSAELVDLRPLRAIRPLPPHESSPATCVRVGGLAVHPVQFASSTIPRAGAGRLPALRALGAGGDQSGKVRWGLVMAWALCYLALFAGIVFLVWWSTGVHPGLRLPTWSVP